MILIANAVIEFISYVHMPCGNVAEIRAKVVVVCLSNRGNRSLQNRTFWESKAAFSCLFCIHKSAYNA